MRTISRYTGGCICLLIQIKAMTRGELAARDALQRFAECLHSFTPTECRNYFKADGYDPE